jgi:hypothetical protein
MTLQPPLPAPRLASPSAPSSKSPAPTGIHSTTSFAHGSAHNDTRRVVTDSQARYFGVVLDDQTLVPATTATVFPTRFADWLIDNAPAPVR